MHIDLVTSIVYIKLRNKLIFLKFHQHKGERSIGKAIKGSMVLDDLFIYFEITGIKECNKTRFRTIKEKELWKVYQ